MVSPDGEVLDTKTNKLVAKQLAGKPQYYYVNVYRDDGKRKLKRVHRFVAEAYVEGRSLDFNVVDHIDRDKFNNHYTNLRWVDNSGNMRNKENSIYIFDEVVKDYTKKYENPEGAYSYFSKHLSEGFSDQQVVDKYQEYLEYGKRKVVVEWEGVELYLVDLCNTYNKDYLEVSSRLSQGFPLWNALYDIPYKHTRSLEVPCIIVTGHWFPTKGYLEDYFSMGKTRSLELLSNGATYQDIISYDSLDHHRQEVRGIRGTVKELCEHFNVSYRAVETNMSRKGMTLEQALFAPRQRVKKLSINGVYNTPKYWCEHFNIDPKKFCTWKSKKKRSFKEAFEHFGIDTSAMTFSEV